MAKTLQFRRGSTATISAITGSAGELFVDTTKKTVVVMDGSTAGGQALQKELTSSVNITAGIITATTLNVTGVLTYEDVTNVDSLGIATARSGLRVTAGGIDVIGVTTVRNASSQDGIIISGRAGGTLSYGITVVPTTLSASRTLTLPDVTGTVVTTGDTGTVTSTMISDGAIVNADINASAAIADTKLATISTAGKVSNSATTATSANTASAIVARDSSNNFSAGTITATLFSGSGESLTSLSATQLTTGTVPGDRGVTSGSSSSSFVEYNGTTATSGQFDGGSTTPSGTTRLNYGGYLYATKFYGDGSGLTGISGGANLSSVSEDVLPSVTGVYDLGSTDKNWYDLFVSNGINFGSSVTLSLTGGYLNLNADLVTQDLTSTSALVGDVLISTNIVTPDKGGYSEGELIIDGNLDVQGNYITLPIAINRFVGSSWSSGGSLSTGRRENASAGTMTAGLTFGGRINAFVFTDSTEEYNGTSWSSGGNLPQTRDNHGGNGTQTAALSVGGSSTNVYEYDGTSWSNGGTYPDSKVGGIRSAGSQTAAVAFGGSSTYSNLTYEYDGTSWSSGGNLITSRAHHGGGGTQTAALAFGGLTIGDRLSSTEEYDGTSWSSSGSLSQTTSDNGGASNNSSAEPIAISAGGITDPSDLVATTEEYDGSLWATRSNLPFITAKNSCTGDSDGGFLSIGGDKTTGGFYLSDTYELSPAELTTDPGSKGQIRFNFYNSKMELYDGSAWVALN